MKILEEETHGKCYQAEKYSLDESTRSPVEYDETGLDRSITWKATAETSPTKTPKNLGELAKKLEKQDVQYFTYFLDGSRHAYKIDDIRYKTSSTTKLYPIIAAQIGTGCCKRDNRKLKCAKYTREIVLAVPNIANADGKHGFFEALKEKINSQSSLSKKCGYGITAILPYKTGGDGTEKFEDRAVAQVLVKMAQSEKDMVASLVKELDETHYLVKDGSLEYKPGKEESKDKRKLQLFKNNYSNVIGLSKKFNPSICLDSKGKPNPGYIAGLNLYERTPVACFKNESGLFGDVEFAIWYIRIRDMQYSRSPFDGIVKVEKILVTSEEMENGIDSEMVDIISANVINERNPTCYGSDERWANHIYPIYLTEQFIKSKYISTDTFLKAMSL